MTEGIRFLRHGRLGVAVLDRPAALNALTREMVQALSLQLLAWREDPEVAAVLVKAVPGRAFCAGGDIRSIHDSLRAGRPEEAVEFYREEYRMNWRIHRYPKPYVALLDGIVMGGGVGISVHGSHRVVSENVLFAMPETGIGFFPDVGATWFLPRCPGEIGTWLGLTGARLGAADCLLAGIGTQHVPSARLGQLEQALSALRPGAGTAEVDGIIGTFALDPGGSALAGWREAIDRCFAGESVAAILAALEREPPGELRDAALEALRSRSPLSLAVTLAQLRQGRALGSFEEAMRLEYRLARQFMALSDFAEGVRALLIDKDRRPRWSYPEVGQVPQSVVERFLAPLPAGTAELSFDWHDL